VSNLVDLRNRGRYKPDVMGLACGKVAATRARLGLTEDEFAEALSRLLSWEPSAEIVGSWERAAAAPPGDVLAACDILSPPDPSAITDEIAIAADEAKADRAHLLAEPGPTVISSLWDDLRQLAHGRHRTPRDAFRAARDIRFQALGAVERTRRPTSLADLYLITGASTALMASTAFDLHRWDAAELMCQSAISYAELTGNDSLLAWTIGLAATLANWRDEPDTALKYFHRGIAIAPQGVPSVRLRYIAARSYALIGDVAAVQTIADDAERDYAASNESRDLMADEVGGEFDFGTARAAACLAAAWLDLGQGQEAAEAAQRAIEDLTALPSGRQPTSQVLGAQIDLATAHVICGELDGAAEIITNSVSTANMLRNTSLAGRLTRTNAALTSSALQGNPVARELGEAVRALIIYQSADSGSGAPGPSLSRSQPSADQ
jgi:tetratricopeptide (TPR) repeat protein